MIILLHTSKSMQTLAAEVPLRKPALIDKAKELAAYIQTLTPRQVAKVMHVSPDLAAKTAGVYADWNTQPGQQSAAIDSFIGDIYSGLQADKLTKVERDYADQHLYILSGLYGILRPYDGIMPYRLEMGYKLPDVTYTNLYKFWDESIAQCLPEDGPIINLAAIEYSKTVTPFVDESRVIAPRFLTVDPKTGEPTFKVVHAKIARGAFARWLITTKIADVAHLKEFNDIGYAYDAAQSTAVEPVFVCKDFGGKGLSIRLNNKPGV